jgi:hypothetical protein
VSVTLAVSGPKLDHPLSVSLSRRIRPAHLTRSPLWTDTDFDLPSVASSAGVSHDDFSATTADVRFAKYRRRLKICIYQRSHGSPRRVQVDDRLIRRKRRRCVRRHAFALVNLKVGESNGLIFFSLECRTRASEEHRKYSVSIVTLLYCRHAISFLSPPTHRPATS